jgi:hypothetical protein
VTTYSISAPDGNVYQVDGPAGASTEQVRAEVLRQHPTAATPKKATERTALQETGRQLGLAGRAVVQGAGSLAALPSDAIFGTVNAVQQMRGKPAPYKLASESIREGLTGVGLPTPETPTERLTGTVEEGLSGAGAGIGAGRVLSQAPAALEAVPGVVRAIGEGLSVAPGAQVTGAVTGPAAAHVAAAAGAPPGVQTLAGLAGGAAGGAAPAIAGAAGRGARALLTPATEAGRQAIAGDVLRSAATNPTSAAARLTQARENVRGSVPTTGEAAGDTGLAYFQQRLRSIGGAEFNERASAQNAARQALLDSVARGGETPAIEALTTRRDNLTRGMRDQAFTEAQGKPVATDKILSDIDSQLGSPENAGRAVQDALKSIRSQLSGTDQPLTDARALYAVRKEVNRILEGRYVGADESVLRYAGSQLKGVRDSIDREISAVAPSWKQYLTKYAQLSRPIERAETIRDVRQRTSAAAPNIATGRDVLSQAKWKSVVDRAMPELRQTLTKGQLTKLNQITADLDRGAAAVAAGKVPGSDTAANLATRGQISVAYVLSRGLGGKPKALPPALGTLTRPLSWVYQLPDQAIRELLVNAMLDPKLAEQLLKPGTAPNVRTFAQELARSSRAGAIAGTEATRAQQ